ncbi:hypothetical protein HU200_061539 [Digitaria exilis]|uniref:HMA domain-containing protein n=1 Tax=Digitaria exilis TaxID=1010633 RepID=A0A835AGW1_9POAL|nr:hypothetical protein HU200_061539 [Digitaria exilis]CAB3481203.1 unnamed protein product [Digitaria exilis]
METNRSREKALALVARCEGVASLALTGDGRDQLEVVGDGIDTVALVSALRRKVGAAEILKVEKIKEGSKAQALKEPSQWVHAYPYYHYPSPQFQHYSPPSSLSKESSDNCSVM